MSHSIPAIETLERAPEAQRAPRNAAALFCTALAVAAMALSYFQPFWTFKLYAPQYPSGLTLTISLTGFSGDVREIDMLNHYIGMGSLEHGAPLERRYSKQLVAVACASVLAFALLRSRRGAALAAAVGVLYPLGFLLDTFYWLHRFGHTLDPRAPLRIDAFTPQLFGNGSIGQFLTFAAPELGFWASIAAAGLLLVAAALRYREERPCCA
ncbi:MAG TPA: hypothetical protein VJR89_24535 [Polyangiales bacterium]|nr:hypothetical protein [Polyangiales bacterium]